MQLRRYTTPVDLRVVAANFGAVLRVLGVVFAVPAGVALLAGEPEYALRFGVLCVVLVGLGGAGARLRAPDLELKEALVVVALAYLAAGLFGALAFLPVAGFIDGFFEATSGFTTTGLSVMDVEALPLSLLFFRAFAQWIGGAGIVVLSLVVLAGPGRSAFQLYAAEYGGENLVGSVVGTARVVFRVYAVLTALGLGAFLLAGMPPRDAFLHVMTTLSTGGFSTHAASIGHYAGPAVPLVVVVGMGLGAVSFPLLYITRREGLRRFAGDGQVVALGLLTLAAAALALGLGGWRPETAVGSLFQAASALTTTGFALEDPGGWTDGSKVVNVLLMLVGGSVGSTAGGIKLLRLLLIVRIVGWLLIRHLLPDGAKVPVKSQGIVIAEREERQAFGFMALYLALVLLSALALTLGGHPAMDAFFESASAVGTVGLSVGITSPELAAWAKLLLAFDMWAGRLEILPVVVLAYPRTWRR